MTESNELAAKFIHKKIRTIVKDQKTADTLCPKITFGCKRLSMGKNYYETFNKSHVFLHDISKNDIKNITKDGITLHSNQHQAIDIIVFATGFDDMVGSLRKIKITGTKNISLQQQWEKANPTMHLGMMTANFPNMFFVTGPGSPSITTNMFATIEQNINWICHCIDHLKTNNITSIEATPDIQEKWANRVNQLASETLYFQCQSRYVGKEKGERSYFMPYLGYADYVQICQQAQNNHYRDFILKHSNHSLQTDKKTESAL